MFSENATKKEKHLEKFYRKKLEQIGLCMMTTFYAKVPRLTSFSVPVSLLMATMAQMRIWRQQVAPMHTPIAFPQRGYTYDP